MIHTQEVLEFWKQKDFKDLPFCPLFTDWETNPMRRQFIHSYLLYISGRYVTNIQVFHDHLIFPTILPYLRKMGLYKLYCLLFLSAFSMCHLLIFWIVWKKVYFLLLWRIRIQIFVSVCFTTWQPLNFWHFSFSDEKLR